MLDWLTTPLSGAAEHHPPLWLIWHARLMVVGWSVVLPLGVGVARFFKVTPGQDWPRVLDNPWWWRWHVRGQSLGVALVMLALAFAFGRGEGADATARAHHLVGWTLASIAATQVLGALLRGSKGGPTAPTLRGDHYDMTLRRRMFEAVHKSLGWLSLPLVILGTSLGLILADAPRWMPLLIGLWWAALGLAFAVLQIRSRRIATYQAIWGPDPIHPGNRAGPRR